jgi:hypothetical protein
MTGPETEPSIQYSPVKQMYVSLCIGSRNSNLSGRIVRKR